MDGTFWLPARACDRPAAPCLLEQLAWALTRRAAGLARAMAEHEVFWKTFVAGGVAGVAEITVMYPLDVAKTRMQLSVNKATIMGTLGEVVKTSGLGGLYRGVITPVLGEAPKRAWKFGANGAFKNLIASASPDGKLSKAGAGVAGALAGITEALVNCPFELIKVRMQAKENLTRFKSSTDCLIATVRGEGVLALYKGVGPQMWRNGVWNGLYFGIIGAMPPAAAGASKQEKLTHKFTTGVLGSFVGTLANTPFDRIKSIMQQQMPDAEGRLKYQGTFSSLKLVAQEEGFGALYKGLGPRLIRLGPGGGIMLVVFDGIMELLKPY